MLYLSYAIILLLYVLLAYICFINIIEGIIPVEAQLSMIGLFFIFCIVFQPGLSFIYNHVIVFASVLIILAFAFRLLKAFGAGALKLIACTTIWYGFSSNLLLFLIYMAIAGGFLIPFLWIIRKIIIYYYKDKDFTLCPAGLRQIVNHNIPYGIAITIGIILTINDTPPFLILHKCLS